MSEKMKRDWIAVNENMADDFRGNVVEIALSQYPGAPKKLKDVARSLFSAIKTPGFRSFDRAPIGLVKPHVVEMMQHVPIAAAAVICLWAEAQSSTFDELRKAAADAGLDLEPSWEWYHGIDGYYALESIEVLAQVVNSLASERSEDERNSLHLAAMWLSGAVVAERADQGEAEGWSTETELVDSPNSDMASIEDPLEPVLPSNPNETNSEQPESEEDSIMTSDSITDEPDTVHATEHEDPIDSAQSDGDSAGAVQITRSVGFTDYETASLERLRAEMLARMEVHAEYRDTLTDNLRRLLHLVEEGSAREVADESIPFADLLSKWTSAAKDLIEFALYCAQRLTSELAARPDFDDHDMSLQFLTDFVSTTDLNAGRAGIARIGELMEQISKYDQQRQVVWEAIDTLRTHMVELLEPIRHWVTEEPIDLARYDNEQTRLTRSELDTLLSEALTDETQLLAQLEQFRELSKNRVENLATTLIQYDVPTDTEVVAGRVLGDIASIRMETISDMELRELELALSERVSEETARARHVKFADLAGDLRHYWDDQVFLDLLRGLADNGRDAEIFLLLVSANTTHPRSVLLNLEPSVVESLLRGIGQFSDKSQPFELANLLAPEIMNGWSAHDPLAQARLCLVFLAAHFSGKSRLPDGFLWNLPNEWPITKMSTWNQLWQMVLLDDSLPVITDHETADVELRLAEAREKVDRVFEHDGRMYVIIKSYRSRRHIALMNNLLLPDLQARTKSLEDIETETRHKVERYPDQIKHLVESLRNSIVDLEKVFSEDTLLEKYEESIVVEGIDDNHPFHRRIAHKTLQEISEVLAQYCSALTEYWESRVLPTATVSRRLLAEELKYIPNPTPLEKPVLDQLTLRKQVNPSPRDASKASDESSRLLVEQLLGVAEHSQRLPRLICLLTANEFAWNDLVDPILQDLSTPLSVTEVASLLLEHEAVSQVLLLAKYGLPVDQQKHAQQALDRMQREVSDLQRELLKTGGTIDDLEHDRQLGRWRFVRQRLSKRLDSQRDRQRAAKQRVEIRARELRNRINDLDEKMFEIRDLMPPTAYDLVAQGMDLVRRATRSEDLFGVAEDFLSELSYRYDHDTWPLTDLQETMTRLSNAVTGQTRIREGQLALNDILGMFESNELRPLGLNTTLVSPSEIGTRADLIRNWITVASIKAFLGDDMSLAERGVVQAVYRSFAQMTVMRYSRTPDNKPIAYEYPVVYSLYELQYPKTPVLEKPCVLLTLPGTPPSPRHLQELGYLIDERKWLDDAFVILFAPGCTPKIRGRLLQEYNDAGLVVIDEFAMRELVLADADSRTPLGRFRSMLLNALGAADIDIFRVNQLVNARNAIFVGRDRLIERIASSGDNYALYGGRRIGKSSVLAAIEARLLKRGVHVVSYSFEGNSDCSDDATAIRLARLLQMGNQDTDEPAEEVVGVDSFKLVVQNYLEANPDVRIALLLDEVDRYIDQNKTRHVFIEALRALSDRFTSRFRVVIAGFMNLHSCIKGRGPYSPASDPWGRMLNDIDALPNLRPNQAEEIVREGFREILDWQFENRAIPQLVVERTGGHPAFVQHFCLKLQHRVAKRGDRVVRISDVEDVFSDRDPSTSFIAYVEQTLKANLDAVSRYLILILAMESSDARGFTFDQVRELARYCPTPIPEEQLTRSLERLAVTSVVKEKVSGVYEFTVPDYPLILQKLGITEHMKVNELEREIKKEIEQTHGRT